MSHNLVETFRETLVKQLVFLDENSQEIMDTYFSSDRMKFKDFYQTYSAEVESYISKLNDKIEEQTFSIKAFIGCRVILKFEDDDDTEEYTICLPDQSDPDKGFISFLSPVGNQLLLRTAGEKMMLNTPGGEFNVEIIKIKI